MLEEEVEQVKVELLVQVEQVVVEMEQDVDQQM
jgi:hypothetical protein